MYSIYLTSHRNDSNTENENENENENEEGDGDGDDSSESSDDLPPLLEVSDYGIDDDNDDDLVERRGNQGITREEQSECGSSDAPSIEPQDLPVYVRLQPHRYVVTGEHLRTSTAGKYSLNLCIVGTSDEQGNPMPVGSGPPLVQPCPAQARSRDNWVPYANRVPFELAELLGTKEQISARNIDAFLALWAAPHLGRRASPMSDDGKDIHRTIHDTEQGRV